MGTLLIVLITGIVTVIAFRRPSLVDHLIFRPRDILGRQEWHRLVTSALIHADWMHVIFNLVALDSFGRSLEGRYGVWVLLFVYVTAVLGGSLLSLLLHRNEDYAALGASGGVSGVVLATSFLIPQTEVSLFLIPIGIPGRIFAILFLVGTFIALKRGGGRIGHDAHFGGATMGLLMALVIEPRPCLSSPVLFFSALVFCIGALVVLGLDLLPSIGGGRLLWSRRDKPPAAPGGRFGHLEENRARRQEKEEIDRILDKIAREGIHSLTAPERQLLDEAARKRGR